MNRKSYLLEDLLLFAAGCGFLLYLLVCMVVGVARMVCALFTGGHAR